MFDGGRWIVDEGVAAFTEPLAHVDVFAVGAHALVIAANQAKDGFASYAVIAKHEFGVDKASVAPFLRHVRGAPSVGVGGRIFLDQAAAGQRDIGASKRRD